jgi:nucleoside-diphosphate-sugar epimerase
MSATALLIGGRGFVGSRLTPVLVERGFRMVCVEPTATNLGRLTPWADHVDLVTGSVADLDAIAEIVGRVKPDLIVNLAFARGLGIAGELDVMARGTWNVLEAAVAGGCRRVVLASSVRVYGPQRAHGLDTLLNEDSPVKPILRYGHYKYLGEQVAADYRRKHGLEAAALRIPMAYGPGVREGAYGVCVPALAAATGDSMTLPYDGAATLCLAHVGEVARALADLGDPAVAPPQHGVYELGGHMVTYSEMVEVAAALVDTPVDVRFAPEPRATEYDFAYRLDNRRLADEYGFEHRSLGDGYQSIIDHVRTEVTP